MTADRYPDIALDIADGIAVITLDRPDKLNAWTREMGDSVQRAVEAAAQDDAVRAIVLTGAGRGFCAGADMALLQGIDPAEETRRRAAQAEEQAAALAAADYGAAGPAIAAPDVSAHYGGRFGYLMSMPKPVIAAINGPCAGLGLVLALYCDLRFASADAKITTAFAQRGLIAEHGIAWLLPRLVGSAHAMDLLLSARMIDGREAERIGLVNRAVEPDALMPETIAYARRLADAVSPRSVAVIKAQLLASPFQDFNAALAAADAAMLDSFASEDFREGVAHYIERRPARFTGR